jgi:hypothetical protein
MDELFSLNLIALMALSSAMFRDRWPITCIQWNSILHGNMTGSVVRISWDYKALHTVYLQSSLILLSAVDQLRFRSS